MKTQPKYKIVIYENQKDSWREIGGATMIEEQVRDKERRNRALELMGGIIKSNEDRGH